MSIDAMLSSERDIWETPKDFFDELDAEFHFTLDTCALPENAKCERYFTPEDDGLSQPWTGVCWCNPPYGRGIQKLVRKALHASRNGATVVMLVPARTDTKWFHDCILPNAEVRFLRGRIRFLIDGVQIGCAPFPSMLVIFRGGSREKGVDS